MRQHYDNPMVLTYHFEDVDFGAGADIDEVIAAPKGANGQQLRGKVIGFTLFDVSEVLTENARVQVGDGTDPDLYFDSGVLGTPAVGSSAWFNDDGAQVDIPNDEDTLTVTFVVTDDGAPTGIGSVGLVIAWW